MKKQFLTALTTGLFMVALAGLAQAAPDSSDDVSYDKKTSDAAELEKYEVMADMKTLRKMLREKALKAMPAAGSPQEEKNIYVEATSQ